MSQRRTARRAPPARKAPGFFGRGVRRLATRPVTTLAVIAVAGSIGFVSVNALVLQSGPHPAPLFAHRAAAPAGDGALARDVQQALAELGFYDGTVDGIAGPGTVAAVQAFEVANGLMPTGSIDEVLLARLITAPRGTTAAAPAKPAAGKPAAAKSAASKAPAATQVATTAVPTVKIAAAKPTPATPLAAADDPGSPEVRRVQKALADLGYGPLTIDGRLGGQTANAVRRFRLDHGLPLSGDIDDRLVEVLVRIGGLPAG